MSCYLSDLIKSEDSEGYAKRANSGMMLGFPVSIGGVSHNPKNGVGYHSTIKVFNKDRDHGHAVHQLAQHLPLNPPDAKNTQIEPTIFKDRNGNDTYVVKLHGRSADKIKEHNGKFAHMGDPVPYEFAPHVSVDKETHDRIKASGARTAHEAGISFGSAELKRGPKTIKTYHHEPDTNEPRVPDQGDLTAKIPYEPQYKKLAASEKDNLCPIHKGALKNAGIALGMAGALAGGHTADAGNRTPASISHTQPKSNYDHAKMLRAIASVESSGGKNTNHVPTSQGTAYGRWALMPNTIHDTIKGHKDLKAKHAKALALTGQNLHNYMRDNKGLEDTIADRHLAHIEHNFRDSPEQIGFAWNQGITGTKRAKDNKIDIANHPYSRKIKEAYGKEK